MTFKVQCKFKGKVLAPPYYGMADDLYKVYRRRLKENRGAYEMT